MSMMIFKATFQRIVGDKATCRTATMVWDERDPVTKLKLQKYTVELLNKDGDPMQVIGRFPGDVGASECAEKMANAFVAGGDPPDNIEIRS